MQCCSNQNNFPPCGWLGTKSWPPLGLYHKLCHHFVLWLWLFVKQVFASPCCCCSQTYSKHSEWIIDLENKVICVCDHCLAFPCPRSKIKRVHLIIKHGMLSPVWTIYLKGDTFNVFDMSMLIWRQPYKREVAQATHGGPWLTTRSIEMDCGELSSSVDVLHQRGWTE